MNRFPTKFAAMLMGCVAGMAPAGQSATAGSPGEAELPSVRAIYDGKVLPDRQANAFHNIDRLFPTRAVNRGPVSKPLPVSDHPLSDVAITSDGRHYDLFDYISLNRVAGLLIMKDDKVVFEDYELGTTPTSRWMSMSVAKSFTSTLVGAAIKDGYIKSLDEPITTYLTELRGSAYEGVTVRNLLQMASGVKWDETYTNPNSDRRHMLNLQLEGQPGTVLKFMATLPRAAPPGTVFNYSTGETHVAGALVRAAIGKPVAQYLSEKIWSKLGMEDDATWWVESTNGLEVGGSGFSATLRDYARFGQFVLHGGVIDGTPVVPDGWYDLAGSPKQMAGKTVYYGLMWWPFEAAPGSENDGAFMARGIFGQGIYINPKEHVVIVEWGARSKPTGIQPVKDADFFAAVVKTLKQ